MSRWAILHAWTTVMMLIGVVLICISVEEVQPEFWIGVGVVIVGFLGTVVVFAWYVGKLAGEKLEKMRQDPRVAILP
jgi:hypothetical protein